MIHIQDYKDFVLLENLSYTIGIKQSQVQKTVNDIKLKFLPILRITEKDIIQVGSAGLKKNKDDISHNIDIVINSKAIIKNNNNLTEEYALAFTQDQIKRMNYECQIYPKTKQLHVNWPINGNKRNGYVEIHFKVTDNLEWIKWVRQTDVYSKSNQYTTKHKELLLEAICENISPTILEYFDNKGNIKYYNKYVFDIDLGLCVETYTFAGRNGILKYPSILFDSKRKYSDKPKFVAEFLFGKGTNPEEIKTFEQVYECIISDEFPYQKKRNRIWKSYKKLLSSKNLEVPEILNKYNK